MKEIWLICSGCYSDIDWHGFFETEQEAKDYCEWHNKYTSDDWNRVWYSKVNSMSFKNEKEINKIVYKITTDGYVIKENKIEVMLRVNPSNRYEMYWTKCTMMNWMIMFTMTEMRMIVSNLI